MGGGRIAVISRQALASARTEQMSIAIPAEHACHRQGVEHCHGVAPARRGRIPERSGAEIALLGHRQRKALEALKD